MALRHVIVGLACLGGASVAPAAPRLALSPSVLDSGADVSYHPYRWLAIRRSITYTRGGIVRDDVVASERPIVAPRAYAMSGDIRPFGNGLRLSLGMREDSNHRLLRTANDQADIGTAQYAPMMSVGFAGEVGEGLSVGADVGLVGRDMMSNAPAMLVTPVEQSRGLRDGKGYRPMLHLSAGYRF